MATGDIPDIVRRLRLVLPNGWFPISPPDGPSSTPVLDAVLTGLAWSSSWIYQLIVYCNLQNRITTATDQFLDIIGLDFLASRIVRRPGQTDARWRARITAEILRPRATRAALASAVSDLTGRAPIIFEPGNASDTGGWDTGVFAFDQVGGWGDIDLPFQVFITAYRPHIGGVANVSGWDNPTGGWDIGSFAWTSLDMAQDAITDDDIYSTIASTMPAAGIAWTRILP